MSYYKYKNLSSFNSESSIQNDYENKLQIIPDVIYPEYKKGEKSLYELAMYYQIEKYLIEEYIQKIEKQHTQNTDNTDNTDNKSNIIETSDDTKMDSILENKLDILEKKLDYIISTLHKSI
jgi:hypothetical protein